MSIPMDLLFFVLGCIIGSFLNVCIYRLPREKSIVTPGSSCTLCGKSIPFYHNVPLVSYLMLRGKCRHCGGPISIRYFAVELLTAALFVALFRGWGLSFELAVFLLFVSGLIVISCIDLEFRIIPDALSLGGVLVGIGFSFFRVDFGYKDALLGVLLGGGVLWAIAFLYELVRKQEGMGGGDIKLLAMIGAFLGYKAVLVTVFVSAFVGSVVGVTLMLLKGKDRKYAIPFGPFLALAAVICLFWQQQLIAWYQGLLYLK
jgi:leader peptidase (prepilin peptidase)/N-methyltransferase